jgi:hypothetical protein
MRRLPLLLALLGLLLVGSGLGYGAYQRAIAAPGDAPLPPAVAGLPLAEARSGAEAAQNITHLHGQAFPLSGAAVGTYSDGVTGATLWVSASPVAPMAARMVKAMEEAIGSGSSPFVPEETRQVGGRPVHVLAGMGQQHFYFRSRNLVIWLAVDETIADDALASLLPFYN